MNNLVLAALFLLLALGGVVVRKTYAYLPARELKRRAERHDPLATQLYKAAAYGNSLRSLLWLYIGLTTAAGLVLMARALNVWVSLLIVAPLLWIVFSLVPATRLTSVGARLTKLVTPILAWLLNYLHRPLSRGAEVVERRYVAGKHTRIFEREDLVELIERQQYQDDNRLTEEELEIARRALSFSNYKVADVLTPRKEVKTILAGETVGPVLIDELHKSGQSYVLVKDKKGGMVVGTLAIGDLGLNSTGQVSDHVGGPVYYLHENDSLSEALHAFFVTNHPMFVVVNSFEEFVGIATVENIIKQLLGHVPGDDFDQYSDPAAVAARYLKKPPEES
ncbi:MAG TPA: CBS domain-containing protein [Candidatus Saccharimonadales bacterium]|jgi:CBS domain containing-hemolysin-like protein|nr:CBS domain-containing protein [Candidatus Saccharimonadales bacterium]